MKVHSPIYRVRTRVPVGDSPAGTEGLGDPFDLCSPAGVKGAFWLVRFPDGRDCILRDSECEPLLEPALLREEGRKTAPPLRPFLPQGLGAIRPRGRKAIREGLLMLARIAAEGLLVWLLASLALEVLRG